MPLFHFNSLTAGKVLRDLEGEDLPDAAAARRVAEKSAREALIEAVKTGDTAPDCIQITDSRSPRRAINSRSYPRCASFRANIAPDNPYLHAYFPACILHRPWRPQPGIPRIAFLPELARRDRVGPFSSASARLQLPIL